jgi:hypothetical protein
MWKYRLWPYSELQIGDTLYWYDSTRQAIVWSSTVAKLAAMPFKGKGELKERLVAEFGPVNAWDTYFDSATDRGYCLAYKVDQLSKRSVPKPQALRFPQSGWLRADDNAARGWMAAILSEESDAPALRRQMTIIADSVSQSGYFSPASLKDERERTLREIVRRQGQPDFRNKLIKAYDGRCAMTACDATAALEAAHIVPYCGLESNHIANGLLLRADIHTLFDLNLIGIHPQDLTIHLRPEIQGSAYSELEGCRVRPPSRPYDPPDGDALNRRWQTFKAN